MAAKDQPAAAVPAAAADNKESKDAQAVASAPAAAKPSALGEDDEFEDFPVEGAS
jgi:hypothetical protein